MLTPGIGMCANILNTTKTAAVISIFRRSSGVFQLLMRGERIFSMLDYFCFRVPTVPPDFSMAALADFEQGTSMVSATESLPVPTIFTRESSPFIIPYLCNNATDTSLPLGKTFKRSSADCN